MHRVARVLASALGAVLLGVLGNLATDVLKERQAQGHEITSIGRLLVSEPVQSWFVVVLVLAAVLWTVWPSIVSAAHRTGQPQRGQSAGDITTEQTLLQFTLQRLTATEAELKEAQRKLHRPRQDLIGALSEAEASPMRNCIEDSEQQGAARQPPDDLQRVTAIPRAETDRRRLLHKGGREPRPALMPRVRRLTVDTTDGVRIPERTLLIAGIAMGNDGGQSVATDWEITLMLGGVRISGDLVRPKSNFFVYEGIDVTFGGPGSFIVQRYRAHRAESWMPSVTRRPLQRGDTVIGYLLAKFSGLQGATVATLHSMRLSCKDYRGESYEARLNGIAPYLGIITFQESFMEPIMQFDE